MRDRYYGTTIDRLREGTEAYARFGETVSPPPPPDLPPEEEPSIWEKIFQPNSPKVQAWQQRQMPIAAVSDVVTAPEQIRFPTPLREPTDLSTIPEGQRRAQQFDEQGNPIGLPPPTPESFLQALARKEQTAFGALGQDIAQKVGQVPGVAPAVEWYTTPHAVPEFISKYGEITLSELAESPEGRAAIDALIAASGPTGIFKNLEAGMKQVKAGVRVTAKELHEGEAGFARIGKEIPKAGEAVQAAKEPWQMTLNEYNIKYAGKPTDQLRSGVVAGMRGNHRNNVAQALSEGKPVPPEVLKDYPDLAKNIPRPRSKQAAANAQRMAREREAQVFQETKAKFAQEAASTETISQREARRKIEAISEAVPKAGIPVTPEVTISFTRESRPINMGATQGLRLALERENVAFTTTNPTLTEIVAKLDEIDTRLAAIPKRYYRKSEGLRAVRETILRQIDIQSGLTEKQLREVLTQPIGVAAPTTPAIPKAEAGMPKAEAGMPVTIAESSGTQWMERVSELDKRGAPDSEYRSILSTASKIGSASEKRVSAGKSTWRNEVIQLADKDLRVHPVIQEPIPKAGVKPTTPIPEAKPITTPSAALAGQGVEAAGVKEGATGAIPPAKPPAPPTTTGGIPIPNPPTGITDALAQAKAIVQRDKPGIITRMIDRIPGLKQLQRKVHPSLGMKDEMVEGWVGRGHTQATVSNTLHADLLPTIKQLESSFGKGATDGAKLTISFIGRDIERVPFTGTLYDILQRPQLYNLSPEQRVLLEQIQANKTTLFKKYRETYGLDIGEFPTAKGAVHVANVDKSKTAISTAGSESAALRRGRAKERFYETGADRYLHDKALADKGLLKQEDVFQPNLNVSGLLAADNETLAAMAGQNVFKAALGGKTKLELMQEIHPALYNKMMSLRKRLVSLRGTAGRLDEKQKGAINDFLNSAYADADLTQFSVDLVPTVTKGKNVGKDILDINKEITGIKAQISALRPAWETANPRGYTLVQEGGLYRYFNAEDARQLKRLTKVSESATLRVVDELRATAFGGDLSPGTIQGLTAWELDPIGVSKAVGREMKLAARDRQLLRGFSKEGLAADIAANPESWQRYSMATGLNPLGMFQREEFGTGFIARIPKVGEKWAEANDALFRGLVKLSKSSFDSIYEVGIKKGLSSEQAAAIAADDVTKLIPSYSYRRLGMSQAEAARYRSALTSVSFLTQPAALISDATKGILKLVTLQPITPTEAYAVKRVLTLSATVSSVAAISNTMYAVNNGKDPAKAALASITPGDPYFWSLVLPNGDRIGLGGPFRSLLRAVAPGNVEGVPVPVPFAGLYRFSFSKMHPAWRIAYDEIRDKDFYGKQIRSGDFPINILQGLEYALESSMPLTAGGVLEDIRRGETKQIPSDVISQFAGVNLTPENKIWNMKREWKDDLDKYESIPTSVLEVKERGILSRTQYREKHPDVDAKLFITGQVSSIQSDEADSIVKKILETEKIDPMTINVVKKWSPEENARRLKQGLKDTLTDSLIKDLRRGK